MRRWFLWGVVFCAGVVVGGLGGWQVGRAQSVQIAEEEGLRVGQRPPRLSAQDLSGARHTLEQYEGNILVLHFWASWCPFCRGEIPKLTMLHEEWAGKGVAVLTVSLDEDLAQLKRFVQETPLAYPVIPDLNPPRTIARQYAVSGIPVTYVIDRDGRTAFRFVGRSDIIGAVKRTLEQSVSPAT